MDAFKIICEALNQGKLNAIVKSFRKKLSDVSQTCRSSIKNGPNYPQQVAVCSCTKKIALLRNFIPVLNRYASIPGADKNAKTLLVSYRQMLIELNTKLISARSTLVKRQRKIPVSMSNKPSPERYNPRREVRGME